MAFHHSTHKTPPGIADALRRFRSGRRGKPTEADRPFVVADGPKRKPLPGQLDLDGRETPPA